LDVVDGLELVDRVLVAKQLLDVARGGLVLLEVDDLLVRVHVALGTGVEEDEILQVDAREGDKRRVDSVHLGTKALVVELAGRLLHQLVGNPADLGVDVLRIIMVPFRGEKKRRAR